MPLDLESFKAIPYFQKVILAVLLLVVLVGGFVYFIYIPKNTEIERLTAAISDLDLKIRKNEAKVRRLDALRQENKRLQRQLAKQMEQLPPEAEVPALLKQISELGARIGLDFKLWKPATQRPSPTGLYSEVPVDVEVAGGYHSVAMFFDRISKLRRIVNVVDIQMGGAKEQRDQVIIRTTFRAVAFALLPGGG